jgi:cystathionine gamma-synthase
MVASQTLMCLFLQGDHTFMTPYFQRPPELGADIVIHSAFKYLGGHNDVLTGLIVNEGQSLSEKMAFLYNSIGSVQTHPAVFNSGLPELEAYEVQQWQAGFSGMLLFRGCHASKVPAFLSALRTISFATSLGSVESPCTYPDMQCHPEIREKVGVCDRLLRLSVGLEHADDLIADLRQLLDASCETGGECR